MATIMDDSKTASITDPSVDDSKTASVLDPEYDVEKKALNDAPVGGSKTASFTNPDVDIEKKELNAGEKPTNAGHADGFQRGISNTQWVLCCIGLYLSAFLYGG
jgi:hypothetical protein